MADNGRLDELKRKFDENPRRYFAPLANEYRKGGEFDLAIELCRTYLPHQPGHMSGYIVYGQALFDAGKGNEAAEIFQEALRLDPENIIALRHLGDIARDAGDQELATQWYRRVLDVDPKNDEIAEYVAELSGGGEGESRSQPTAYQPPAPPPAVRPEPEPDPSAVALSELMEQPDTLRDASPAPFEAAQSTGDETSAENVPEVERAPEQSFELIPPEEPPIDDFLVSRSMAFEYPPDEHNIALPHNFAAPEDILPPPMSEAQAADTISAMEAGLQYDVGHDETPVEAPSGMAGEAERADSASPFVTETMATLYLQQGFVVEALEVYRKLVTTRDEPRLREKVRELEAQLHAEPAPSATGEAAGETVRAFFARIGARRPSDVPAAQGMATSGLGGLFQSTAVDDHDTRAAASLADAFGNAS